MPDDLAGSGAERDADPDLARALPDHERHDAVDADRREDEREHRERASSCVEKRRDAVAAATISSIVRTPNVGRSGSTARTSAASGCRSRAGIGLRLQRE